MKKLLAILLLLSYNLSWAWTQTPPRPMEQCLAEAPWGFPQGKSGALLCRLGYATSVDVPARLPMWTVYTLTPKEAIGCWPRTNAFVSDQYFRKGDRAEPDDYAGTGYDKGHVAPDGDMSWDEQVEYESFLMTNMMPQKGGLNRGIWKLLETHIRAWTVQKNTEVTIYAGPIYKMGVDPTIGKNRVVVPHAFYKIVIDNSSRDVLAFIFAHEGGQGNNLNVALSTVAEVEKRTGLRFPIPKNANLKKNVNDFPVDFGALTNAKRAMCKK